MHPAHAAHTALTVTAAEDGVSVQELLSRRLRLSRRAAKALLDARAVWVNRQRVWMTRHALRRGDIVEAPAAPSAAPPPHLRVLVEDARYLFVDKPAGLLAVGEGSAEEVLRGQLGAPGMRAVHRLDRDTSGCLLFARDAAAFEAAVALFRTRRVVKVYHAVCLGRVTARASTIRLPVEGEPAVTHLRLLSARDEASYVALRIETGRTHQIRLHLASVRHPVLGDRQYGPKFLRDERLRDVPRQMLHATDLELPHPLGSGRLRAHSPLPADFRRCLRVFGL
jgi:23S rRNA pseudouridine1911/1915/1917 synthase